jgi:hypothetical protein
MRRPVDDAAFNLLKFSFSNPSRRAIVKSISLIAALAAVLLACTAQAAFAHEFVASPAASGFLGKGGTQTVTLGGHAVSCKAATIDGHASSASLGMEVKYESCEAFSKPATISEADFAYPANNTGGVAEGTTMKVTAKPTAESECVYTLPTTAAAVESVTYKAHESGITISSALKGLTYELKETGTTSCGKNGEKASTGEYKGEVTTETYEGTRCVWWLGGAYAPPGCSNLGSGFKEIVSGYTSLKWL